MRDAAGSRRSSPFAQAERAVGCPKLGEMGLVDLDLCCERCHAADRFALDGIRALEPCREVLADGTAVLVCCAARKQLILKRACEWVVARRVTGRGERGDAGQRDG